MAAEQHGPPTAALSSALVISAGMDAFQGDEGYSEDARSLDDGDSTMGVEPRFPAQPDPLHALYEAVKGLDESQRSEHAYNVLRTLRTSSIAAIVERLTPLLHLDPVAKLPPDITALLFSYLEPRSLLAASLVSKPWRERTLDTLLWRHQFRREGWTLDMSEVRRFERNVQPVTRKSLSRKATEMPHRRPKRPRESSSAPLRSPPVDGVHDQEMQDAEPVIAVPALDRMDTSESTNSESTSTEHRPSFDSVMVDDLASPAEVRDPPILTRSYSGSARVNFHYVYKQKRRLEDNWAKARFKSFQLPHRDHPEEAHSECVYTIQYAGNYLVSGSRDKTLRIWDLDTQRLVRRPLEGHKASVLCLQFDASPEEDLIVSGSSDTDVILWCFSTGKMLKRIPSAHRESVLNLKFDKRFLVTCSKDKMIKIWNRSALLPGDVDYPRKGLSGGGRCPSYVLDWTQIPPPLEVDRLVEQQQLEPIPPYSLIMKIDDHGAAVNAVHIYQDQLVSASGDRALRVFDIHSGVRVATCKGHNKGIACVQYDGRRIVSGSSDNTIRIFDPQSQAEVACLLGHSKLVRTVQAAFGDVPGSEADLEAEARAADRAFFRAQIAQAQQRSPRADHEPPRASSRRTGSSLPEELTVLGAKLPPGGGGSPWARIVSGSYDETIIIWRKAADGKRWVVGHTLRQEDALRAAGGPLLSQSERTALHPRRLRAPGGTAAPGQHGAVPFHAALQPAPVSPSALGAASAEPRLQFTGPAPAAQPPAANPTPVATTAPGDDVPEAAANWPLAHGDAAAVPGPSAAPSAALQAATAAAATAAAAPPSAATLPSHPAPSPHPAAAAQPPYATSILPPHLQAAAAAAANAAHAPYPNARVFKLQFDARRIICCSQDPKIVGWDFAAGDSEIEEAARFFGGPQ